MNMPMMVQNATAGTAALASTGTRSANAGTAGAAGKDSFASLLAGAENGGGAGGQWLTDLLEAAPDLLSMLAALMLPLQQQGNANDVLRQLQDFAKSKPELLNQLFTQVPALKQWFDNASLQLGVADTFSAEQTLSGGGMLPAALMAKPNATSLERLLHKLEQAMNREEHKETASHLLKLLDNAVRTAQVQLAGANQNAIQTTVADKAAAAVQNPLNSDSAALQQMQTQQRRPVSNRVEAFKGTAVTVTGLPVTTVVAEQTRHLDRLKAKGAISPFAWQQEQTKDESGAPNESNPASSMVSSFTDVLKQSNTDAPKQTPVPVNAHRFAEEFSSFLLKGMKVTQFTNGLTEAKLSLNPEQLGQVDVRISVQNGQVVAQFVAETAQGKESIEQQMAALRSALQNQGLNVQKLEVTVQQPNVASGFFQDQRQQQGSQQGQTRQNPGRGQLPNEAVDFAADLEYQTEAREILYGNSFSVTA